MPSGHKPKAFGDKMAKNNKINAKMAKRYV
jgi:hypothetical protein